MRFEIKINNKENNTYYKNNPEFFETLLDLVNKKPKWKKILLNDIKYKNIYVWVCHILPQLNSNFYTLETKLFWIFNNITNFPKCNNINCNRFLSDKNVETILRGYHKYCSHMCAVNSNEVKEKTKKTCLKKYGVSSPGQNEKIKEKSKKTCLKKYGTEYSFNSKEVKEKSKVTLLQKYGVDHPSKNREIYQKIIDTKKDKYGSDQPWHTKKALLQRKQSWMQKYGVEHPVKTSVIKNKIRKTIKEKYGAEFISQTENFKRSRAETIFNEFILNNKFDEPLFSFDDFYKKNSKNDIFKFKCRKCRTIFESSHKNGHHKLCPICFPIHKNTSLYECEVFDFISKFCLANQSVRNIISPLELDIYIPSKNLAFEFNGLYWHCNENKEKEYHVNKTKLCEEKGIQLIHIFENEWVYKQDIVKSRIKNLLGIYDKKIYARQCEIRVITTDISRKFQNENHIQGYVGAAVHLGLFYDNELISLMTFGKSRFSKKYEWELLRFCNKLGYHIPGSASKLLTYFEKNYKPKSLVSYADRRWSIGNVYKKLGFKLDHISKPDYWYFKNTNLILESRVKYQKHKLEKMLEKFDNNKTEVENMKENGYYRIFDCGNMVFEKNYG